MYNMYNVCLFVYIYTYIYIYIDRCVGYSLSKSACMLKPFEVATMFHACLCQRGENGASVLYVFVNTHIRYVTSGVWGGVG